MVDVNFTSAPVTKVMSLAREPYRPPAHLKLMDFCLEKSARHDGILYLNKIVVVRANNRFLIFMVGTFFFLHIRVRCESSDAGVKRFKVALVRTTSITLMHHPYFYFLHKPYGNPAPGYLSS